MFFTAKKNVKKLFDNLGYDIHKKNTILDEFYRNELEIINSVKPYTYTTRERIFALIEAVRYVIKNNIPGDFVECGVWKGGSVMAMMKTLLEVASEREIYLFDTFAGMTKPTDKDKIIKPSLLGGTPGRDPRIFFEETKINDFSSEWGNATVEEVKKNLSRINFDMNKIHFVVGRVEYTIPEKSPREISLLRLDTDWYESTRHELTHLFPRLSKGGIVLVDDYWAWKGSKLATDEYFKQKNITIFLKTTDPFGGVIGVKIK